MIYGALEDLPRYRGFCRSLDVLIDWLAGNDPASLDVGSHAILGDKVFANVMAPTTPSRRRSALRDAPPLS